MALFEIPVTIEAASQADAEKKAAEVEKLLPIVKGALSSKGIKVVSLGKPKAKA